MKTKKPISISKYLLLFCLFSLGNFYGQSTSDSGKTVFGKTVKESSINPTSGQLRCVTPEYEEYLQKKNPSRKSNAEFEAWVTPLITKYKEKRTSSSSKTTETIITIPVVIHVIHSGQTIGVAPNIVDDQVISQITVLNEDYRKMFGTPGYNTNSVGADCEIEFVLATVDPDGNPTNGIDRVNLCEDSWSTDDIESTVKPNTIWDPTSYMNMWSVNFTDSTLLGYAQFPDSSTLEGLSTIGGSADTDGVVSNYTAFGSIDYDDGTFLLDDTYNTGRTMTHEIGHWLGLRHIWGDDTCGDDYCDDTPTHEEENYGCPTAQLSCYSTTVYEMPDNYMDYTDDSCMDIFTENQKDRMMTVMSNSPRRSTLSSSTKATAITLYSNDAEVKIESYLCENTASCSSSTESNKEVLLYNRGTSTLTSATLNYTINGGDSQSYSWSGSLAENKSETITLPDSSSYGILIVSIATVNGGTDERSTNDTATATFETPVSPSSYNFTNFTFTLQQDHYGSETTWNLTNSSGVVKYTGGPYTDSNSLPTVITKTWTLDQDECYTFTIEDAEGDGICCDYGQGYYTITSTDGDTTVASGSDFGDSDTISFSTTSLSTASNSASNEIYLYPNPTSSVLTIYVSDTTDLPTSYSIYNNLGQMISQKTVSSEDDLTLSTSALSNGIYIISIKIDGNTKNLKFIKK
jgi:hypothetical protein